VAREDRHVGAGFGPPAAAAPGVAPDFLAVIDFDRKSGQYGQVLRTVPPPSPGNTGNEPHHCHTSADQTILACGGLLSVLKGQNDIFFFDITDARHPRFLSSTKAPNSPSDFVNPATTLNAVPGDLQLRSSLRFWDLQRRRITRTVLLPDNAGTMDAKLIPGDPHGRAVTVNMFTGLMYSVDPTDGSYEQAFDTETITPHVATEVRGGLPGLLAIPRGGRRLIFAAFMAGQVGMLDITNPKQFKQVSVVSFGKDTGPDSVHLTHDGKRLVVTDYFLNQDGFGKVHMEGDHKVHVLDVREQSLTVDPAFRVVDFNTAFSTGRRGPTGSR
jgi:hypothetical protein